MDRIRNFLIGAGTVLRLFPQVCDYSDLILSPSSCDSVRSALEADWQKVGMDMHTAITQYEHEAVG